MKVLLTCLYVIFATYSGSCTKNQNNNKHLNTFEFGENIGRIAYTSTGSLGRADLFKSVVIRLPDCMDLKYVRVDVETHYGPPTVVLNWKNQTVTMTFEVCQWWPTNYIIKAKALPSVYCDNGLSNRPIATDSP